ncbi:MAG: DUF3368 domain-containing protein [Armatimonadota bacterium]
MKPLAIVDTSCLIGLEGTSQLHLLPALFSRLIVPPAVQREFGSLPDTFHVQSPANNDLVQALRLMLGQGEAEVIALGTELRSTEDCELVLDDWQARRVAKSFGLSTVGTIGILLRAKKEGLLEAVQPAMDVLRAHGFYISDALYRRALELAGET